MRLRRTRKGITLIELLLALSLSAVVMGVMFSFYLPHQKALMDTEKKSQLKMDAQNIMQYLSKGAMEASKISSVNGINDSAQLNLSFGARFVSSITFEVDDENGVKQYDYQFLLNGRNLYYADSKVTNKLIASTVNYIDIEPSDGQAIGKCSAISVTIELISSDGKIKYDISDNLFFRNKAN